MSNNERAENFGLFLVVGGLVLGFALYGLFLFWPYFVFYALPLIFGSVVVGIALWVSVLPAEGSRQARFPYKRLAIVYPIMIAMTLVIFQFGSEKMIMVDKSGKPQGQVIEWMSAHQTFNEWRRSTYADSPFDSLKAKAKAEELYDRAQMGGIAWCCLFLGGPLMFFWLSRNDEDLEEAEIEKRVYERVGTRQQRLQEKSENLDKIIETRIKKSVDEAQRFRLECAKLSAENQVLKATVEFSSDIKRPSESAKTSGVLDQDIL